MNLQSLLPQPLWMAISSAYLSENYSNAISEGMIYLTELLRERGGVDGDGASLVGAALGGDSPKLKLSPMNTESQRNIQKGYEQIIRGLYVGVRNPRSHDVIVDDKETADAILNFLGHVSKMIFASKEAFSLDGFLNRIEDSDFVTSERYAQLIVAEVPPLKRADALIHIYRYRLEIDLRSRIKVVNNLIGQLSPPQVDAYLQVVSAELRTATESKEIRTIFQMLTPVIYTNIDELSRLRVEQKILKEIDQGEVLSHGANGALGTWANSFIKNFSSDNQLRAARALLKKIDEGNEGERKYAIDFFIKYWPDIFSTPALRRRLAVACEKAVERGDINLRSKLLSYIEDFPSEFQDAFALAFKKQTDENNPATLLHDGSPFLSAPTVDDFVDDEL